ncbi:MAG: hypothetical protein ACI9H8_001707 [Lysobacterales bacterium]|jgi:hypothetical protein
MTKEKISRNQARRIALAARVSTDRDRKVLPISATFAVLSVNSVCYNSISSMFWCRHTTLFFFPV